VSRRDLSARGLRPGDLILEKSGGGEQQPVGRCVRFTLDRLCVPTNFACRLRPLATTSDRFLAYLLASLYSLGVTRRAIKQTTGIQNLDTEVFLAESVRAPDRATQERIADFLDNETARIDALIEKKQRMLKLIKDRYIATVDVSARECGLRTVRLKRVGRVSYGLGQPPPLSDDGIPIIRATNIDQGRVSETDLLRARREDLPLDRAPLLRAGEVLVVRSGAFTGDSALINADWAGSAPGYDLRITPTGIEPRFLAHQLLGRFVQDQIELVRLT
jgi:hypothetical protein